MRVYPTITLKLTPAIHDGSATGLICRMCIPEPQSSPAMPLLSLPMVTHGVPTQDYTTIEAHDEQGSLSLKKTTSDNTVSWVVDRATSGDVYVEFEARPRKVDRETPIKARVDLRSEGKGLLGCGVTFIPFVNLDCDLFDYTVIWDLEHAPSDWRGVWTFSVNADPTTHRGDQSLLQRTFYCVGPMESIEAPDSSFGIYWLTSPLDNIMKAARASEKLFRYLSAFFESDPSQAEPYKIFLRNAWPARGYGGSAALRSYCLEYDPSCGDIPADDIEQLLAHEMIHNWPAIGSETDSDREQFMVAWFSEGIANLYSVLLPYQASLISEDQFLDQMNDMLSAYYTHPYVNRSQKELADLQWSDPYAVTLSYYRGMVYLFKVRIQLEQESPGIFDDIVRSLSVSGGQIHDQQEWLDAIQKHRGNDGIRDFLDMLDGKLVTLPESGLDPQYRLKTEQRGVFDLGMDPASFNQRVVSGLRSGTRAEQAGLRNGDRIIDNSFLWVCEDHYATTLQMEVERAGRRLQFSYWPRSLDTVMVWQLVKQ